MTWKGWVIEESLEDKKLPSGIKIISSLTEENVETGQVNTWHTNTVQVDDENIGKVVNKLQKIIKLGWYAHFTDYKNLIVVFYGKHFTIKIEKVLKEDKFGAQEFKAYPKDLHIWKDAIVYGAKEGKVDPRYIIKVI